jgi:hypothetical protein
MGTLVGISNHVIRLDRKLRALWHVIQLEFVLLGRWLQSVGTVDHARFSN